MATYLTYEVERNGEEDYDILKHLGKGTYGEVVMAVDRETGKRVALKMVKKEKTQLEAFLHELCVSIYLSGHEGIITTYSSYLDTLDHYIFSQELAPAGTLHSIIETGVGIPEKLVKRCALQITQALVYMHSKGLVHRDLKPDNILLMDKGCHSIKLSDFGLTQLAGTVVPSMSPIIPYMSPELCELKPKESIVVDASVDIWAFGVLLYVTLTGYFPWKKALVEDPLFQRFIYWQSNIDHVTTPKNWKKVSRWAQDLFLILFSQEPSCRNQVEVVLNYLHYPWNFEDATQEIVDLLEQQEEEDVEMADGESEVIVIQQEEELIVVENRGDLEFIIVNDPASEFAFISTSSAVLFMTDDSSLYLGSEVEL